MATVVGLVIASTLAIWVYRDAKRRQLPDPGVWAMLGATGVGAVYYLVKRRQT